MENRKLLSLCIPTNGIVEWVFPALDSIFAQGVSEELYEVVVTDNGSNAEFYTKMKEYQTRHTNIVYAKTDDEMFLNEISSYQHASGVLIKFVNHRSKLLPGTVSAFIEIARKYEQEKPVIFFSNGVLEAKNKIDKIDNFEEFVKRLGYYSSWSTGMAIWKNDFDKLPPNTEFNKLFPHTTVLFSERNKKEYIIDDRVFMRDDTEDYRKKGKYDLFFAFAIEYPSILLQLVRDGDLSIETFLKLKSENFELIMRFYLDFVIRRIGSSFDTSSLILSLKPYYSVSGAFFCFIKMVCKRSIRKIGRILGLRPKKEYL